VTATVRNPDLRKAVAALGADHVVAADDFERHGPYDVILELVGATNLAANLEALAARGRIALIGVGAGRRAELDFLALMNKRATIRGSTLRSRSLEEKALAARAIEREVLPHLVRGTVRVPVAASFPLEQAPDAYERFAAGAKLGKVLITTG
jgi:NADPH:quinone reductase-like Zn-dependent oxidoreductase